MAFKDPAKRKEYQKAFYERNKQKIIAHNLAYYHANREAMNQKQKEYYQRIYHPAKPANPESPASSEKSLK